MPPPVNYDANLDRETLEEIRKAEATVSRCKRIEEMKKEELKVCKAETVQAIERLRSLSRGERGMFDHEE